MQTGPLLGPSDKRQGPDIHITSSELRRTRSQSTPTRRPPSHRFGFRSGMPMRTDVISMPGLSHSIDPAEHVWNQLSSTFDASCTTAIYPTAAGVSEPLSSGETLSTTLDQAFGQLSVSTNASPLTSMYQPPLPSPASPTGSVQAHQRTESCSNSHNSSSTRPYRPIIDGSLKNLD